MRVPYQRHLEWLVLEGQSRESIKSFYNSVQISPPTDSQINSAEEAVSKLVLPRAIKAYMGRGIFRPQDTPYFAKLGYGEIHAHRCDIKTPVWETIGKVLAHGILRVALDCCIAANVPDERMAQILSAVYKVPLNPASISIYRRYFADYASMARQDWIDYFSLIRNDSYTYQRLYTALTRPADELLFMLELPTQKQFADFLKNVLATSDFKFRFYSRQNGPEADDEARKWAKTGVEAGEKFEKYGGSDITDFASLVQTEFEYITPEIPTITPEMLSSVKPAIETVKKENTKAPELPAGDQPSNATDI